VSSLSYYHDLRRLELEAYKSNEVDSIIQPQDATFEDRCRQLMPDTSNQIPVDLITVDWTPLDSKLTQLCETYIQASAEQRAFLRFKITADQGWVLNLYSRRMAVFGLRTGSEETIRNGLVAHAIENLAAGDVRDNIVALTLLFHAANRCSLDPFRLFSEIAEISGPAISALLKDYLKRDPQDRTLACMGFREVMTAAGPGYAYH
jgi:hypothetical protein